MTHLHHAAALVAILMEEFAQDDAIHACMNVLIFTEP